MKFISRRYFIKIPSEISVLYSEEKQKLLIVNDLKKTIINLKIKLKVLKKKNCIIVTDLLFLKTSKILSKQNKSLRGMTYFLIKKTLKNIKLLTCKKLKLVGVGYKVFEVNNTSIDYNLLHFKLGYSHNIYYKIPKSLKVKIHKSNKLFVIGYDFNLVCKTSAVLKSYRYPEPYKGKGILYSNETIKLKEGKKV